MGKYDIPPRPLIDLSKKQKERKKKLLKNEVKQIMAVKQLIGN